MSRRILSVVCALAFALTLGCGGGDNSKQTTPDNLEYGKDGPPKRDGVKGEKR